MQNILFPLLVIVQRGQSSVQGTNKHISTSATPWLCVTAGKGKLRTSEAHTRSSVNTTKSSRSIKLQYSYRPEIPQQKIHNTGRNTAFKMWEYCFERAFLSCLKCNTDSFYMFCSMTNLSFILKPKYLVTSLSFWPKIIRPYADDAVLCTRVHSCAEITHILPLENESLIQLFTF